MQPRIRRAKFGDIPAMHEMIVEAHDRSRYAELGKVNEKLAKATLMTAIQRHNGGLKSAGGFYVAVAENGERLEGMIVGLLQPLYHVLDIIEAQDVFWYAREGAHALTALRLMRAFHKWVPDGAIITNANNDAITDPEASGRLLERLGMRRIGGVYQKEKHS